MAKSELKQIKIKLVRGLIGASDKHYNSATILGMVNKVPHLVQIVE